MLIWRRPKLQALGADQRRHAHAIVIDKFEFTAGRDHDIGVLQVAVGNLLPEELSRHRGPLPRRIEQGSCVALAAAVLYPLEERLALDPIHEHYRIALAVAQRADFVFAVLKRDQTLQPPRGDVGADLVVAAMTMRRGSGKNTDGHGSSRGIDPLVDYRERARPGSRLTATIPLDRTRAEVRIPKSDFGILQNRLEVGG